MKKRLIINADDYGMSRGTVDAIIQCANAGVVTSTTMMATGEAFAYGIERKAELGATSIGVHLDATSGRPVSPAREIPSLVDDAGRFRQRRGPASVVGMSVAEMELEFRRQIERIREAGISVSHLDNHHNWVYFSPEHFRATARLAREYGIPLRVPFSSFTPDRVAVIAGMTGLSDVDVRAAVEACCSSAAELGVAHTDYFWIEFTSIHRSSGYLAELLRDLPAGTSEICVHPGLDTDRQKQELEILLGLAKSRTLNQVPDLALATYSELARRA
jgi:hypothetical protein